VFNTESPEHISAWKSFSNINFST
jgi:serine/threonine protein kinase